MSDAAAGIPTWRLRMMPCRWEDELGELHSEEGPVLFLLTGGYYVWVELIPEVLESVGEQALFDAMSLCELRTLEMTGVSAL